MRCKYILYQRGPFLVPIVWPENVGLTHVEVAILCRRDLILGAGFTDPELGWACSGESVSLGVKSNGAADAAHLRGHFIDLKFQEPFASLAPRSVADRDPFPHHD